MVIKKVNQEPEKLWDLVVFIDGPNFNGVQQLLEVSIDFKKLYKFLVGDAKSVVVRYHTQKPTSSGAEGFLKFLSSNGYQVVVTPEGDVDQTLLSDVQEFAPKASKVVLVGGDSDYIKPFADASTSGTAVTVYGTSDTVAADYHGISEVVYFDDFIDQIIDIGKTRRREQIRREDTSLLPGATEIGSLLALGQRISVETRPDANEIIIRIKLSNGSA